MKYLFLALSVFFGLAVSGTVEASIENHFKAVGLDAVKLFPHSKGDFTKQDICRALGLLKGLCWDLEKSTLASASAILSKASAELGKILLDSGLNETAQNSFFATVLSASDELLKIALSDKNIDSDPTLEIREILTPEPGDPIKAGTLTVGFPNPRKQELQLRVLQTLPGPRFAVNSPDNTLASYMTFIEGVAEKIKALPAVRALNAKDALAIEIELSHARDFSNPDDTFVPDNGSNRIESLFHLMNALAILDNQPNTP